MLTEQLAAPAPAPAPVASASRPAVADVGVAPGDALLQSGPPNDSSRVLLALIDLVRQGEQVTREDPEGLDSVVARTVLRRLLSALNYRDAGTLMHSRRVAQLAVGMAKQLGWQFRHLRVLEVAALLHDVGNIGVSDHILRKPAELSPEEAELIAVHHKLGVDLLQACRLDKEVIHIVADMHGGCAVPDAARQTPSEIHLGAKILTIADAYDVLTHSQAFRGGMKHEEAMQALGDDADNRFDPKVVAALGNWVDHEGQRLLTDESQGALSNPAGAAVDQQEAAEAATLCQMFSQLYVCECLYDGFYLLDADLKFVLWNRRLGGLLGRTASQMLGARWSSTLIPVSDERGRRLADHECQVKQVIRSGLPACGNLQAQHKKGEWIEIELQTLPLVDGSGHVQGVVEIFRNAARDHRDTVQSEVTSLSANRDALTGIANRGEMEKHLAMLFGAFDPRRNDSFSVIFLDIDHFKAVNDTRGVGVGDRVLISVARLLQSELVSGELVARYGGEEFVILCPSTDQASAVRKAEHLRQTLAQTSIGEQPRLSVTASLGVSQVEPGDTPEMLLDRADTALFNAKQTGRNRTCSLSRKEVDRKKQVVSQPASQRNLFQGSFTTCMMPEMAVYKIGGFVSETDAKVVKVTEQRVSLQVGRRNLFSGWGSEPARQPVDLLLDFGEPKEAQSLSPSKRVMVGVTIRPIGRPQNPETFQKRCKHVLELLRCHFAAD